MDLYPVVCGVCGAPLPGHALGVVVEGGLAYVADLDGGLYILRGGVR